MAIMTFLEASELIRNEKASPLEWVAAATLICSVSSRNDATYLDILKCLEKGGLCAGLATIELYARTGRPLPKSQLEISRDFQDWVAYLTDNNLI